MEEAVKVDNLMKVLVPKNESISYMKTEVVTPDESQLSLFLIFLLDVIL